LCIPPGLESRETLKLYATCSAFDRRELLFWKKARNGIWGIAFWGKLGYFIENETLARLYATISAHRHSMNEEVPW
jgi:hypothetical protein